jgi:hypothetical protein
MKRRRPYDQSDVPLLLKVFTSYILWCIGKLTDRDREELEELTPELRQFFPHPGAWYEIMEREWDLAPPGRVIINQSYEDVSDDTTPDEFILEWVEAFFKGIDRMSKRHPEHARRKTVMLRKQH